jgi:phosphohistidine phosphatase
VVLRHAKSAWPHGVTDHDRPLEPRGVKDAGAAGEWILAHVGVPDHVVVSSARRTRGTWTIAATRVGYVGAAGYDVESRGPLTIDPRVYEASTGMLLTVVQELPDRVDTAVLVGHNPGCEGLVHLLSGERDPEAAQRLHLKYPTSGIAVLEFDGAWVDLAPGAARLTAFAVPRGAEDD